MKKLERYTFIIVAFIIAALASCVRDLGGGKEKSGGDDMALVTLSLAMPSAPASRAMSEAQENAVTTIDVLLFATGDDNLYYRAAGTSITGAGNTKQFNVKLPTGTYNVVVLANATALLAGISPSTLFGGNPPATSATGNSRATVLDGLVMTTITDGAIPAWGYKNGLVINESTPSPAATIDLTRAIARVDVSLDAAVTNFKLKNVYLYNSYSAGSVTPDASNAGGNVDGYDGNQWKEVSGEKKAIAPNIPAAANKIEGPAVYVVPGEQERAFTRSIYTFEAPAGNPVTGAGWETNTCLVVGGTYTDEDDNDIDSYYRVEFRSGDGNANPYTYLALSRNHLYNVVIEAVNAPGWPTVEDAYANKPSNIVVKIIAWNDGGMNDVVFNGQYSLTVDKSRLEFYKEGYAKSMTVTTTYPSGWNVEDLPSWLTPVTTTGGAAGATATLTFTAVPDNPGDIPRSGEFYIVAGNLRKKITVAQSDEIEFWIAITDLAGNPITELLFEAGDASNPPVEQPFRVTWLPVTATCSVTATAVGALAPFNFGTGDDPTTAILASGIEFTIEPPYNPTTSTRVTRVDFSITDDTRSMMLPLYLRQERVPSTYAFSADGKTLTLFSNFPRDEDLAGLNDSNIPELQDGDIAAAVTTLVIQGADLTSGQIEGIQGHVEYWDSNVGKRVDGLLPGISHVSLPDFTGNIPMEAFMDNDWLTSFESLANSIGYQAFCYCTSLTSVYLPKLKTLDEYAFWLSASLNSVYLPEVEFVGERAFAMCGLKTVDLPVAETIDTEAFAGCTSLETVNLPAVQTISTWAFSGCTSLETVELSYPGEMTTGNDLFYSVTTTDIDLHLGAYEYDNNVTGGTTWKGYTFNSITRIP